jgi:O-antigen ligase
MLSGGRLRFRDNRGTLISSLPATVPPAAEPRTAVRSAGLYRFTLPCAAVTCALLPWYTVRWHYGPFPTTLLETGILITIAVFLLESWRSGLRPDLATPLSLPAALFIVAGAISVIVAPDHRAALGLYRAYILEPIAFFFVVAFVVRNWSQARWILCGLAIAGIAVSVPNIYVVSQAIRHHVLNVAVAPPVAIYQTANATALFLVPLIAVAAAIVVYGLERRDRIGSALFVLVAGAATLLSFSRAGYLALLAVAIVLVATHPARLWLLAGVAVLAAVFSRIPPIASRIGHEINLQDPNNSLEERFRLWGATLRMLRDHPIFGAGLSGFKQTVDKYRAGVYTENLIYPHNIVLNFWSETGLLGLAAFAWVVMQAARLAWAGWRTAERAWRPLYLGVLLMLVGVVVHGLVDVPYWKNDLSLEFWVLLGLAWAGQRWATASAD